MAGIELLTRAALETAMGFFLCGGSRWSMAELLRRLEEEKAKIVVFQREIPLCVSIISYVLDALKAEDNEEDHEAAAAGNEEVAGRPVLEEFIPIHREAEDEVKDIHEEKDAKMTKNMANWMSSVQLWSGGSDDSNNKEGNNNSNRSSGEVSSTKGDKMERSRDSESVADIQDGNKSRGPKGFPIFSGYSCPGPIPDTKDEAAKIHLLPAAVSTTAVSVPMPPFPGLSLCPPAIMDPDSARPAVPQQRLPSSACFKGENLATQPLSSESDQHHSSSRKARRCWSADLHRKFVCALEELGGPRVATPKQIRELMKVEGLTNDEVKSHLQKYRLHARKQTTSKDLKRPDLRLDLWADAESQNPTPKMRSCSSSSPSSHFDFVGSTNERSPIVVAEPSEDGKSDSYTWNGYTHRSRGDLWLIFLMFE